MSDKIYRVVERATGSYQPGGGTSWMSQTLYCGADLTEARTAYLRAKPGTYWGGPGNRCKEVIIEAFDAEPNDIESTDSEEVEE